MWAVCAFLVALVLWEKFTPPGPNKFHVNWSAISLKRALGLVGLMLLVVCMPQFIAAGLDLPFLLSFDLTILTDFLAHLIILGVQEYIRPLTAVARKTLSALQFTRRTVIRAVRRARRTRPLRTSTPPSGEKDGGWVFA